MSATPHTLLEIADRVVERLSGLIDSEQARWTTVDPVLAEPFESLRTLVLGGGKRLRPAFCQWGYVAGGGTSSDDVVVDAGAAFELLHAFALFHDDVMDGSATRRGHRTAHLTFGDRHDASGWVGESRRFGEGVAILIGDLAFVYADQLLQGAPRPALDIWNELRLELNVGQYLDVLGTARRERGSDTAARIARYKSGKYTVERPLHLGAALAAPDELPGLWEQLSSYGLPLGDAFQLRDDVLGVFGDHLVTGKPVGDDLREGKPTALLAIATELATAAQLVVLADVGRNDLSDVEVARMQAVIIDTGALAEIERRISELTEQAIASITRAPIPRQAMTELVALARYVAWRER